MTKKKIKSTKQKKQAKENKYFMGAMMTVGGLLVVGIAFALLFGGGGKLASTSGDHGGMIQNTMDKEYSAGWQKLGFIRWQYAPNDTMFYYSDDWYQLPEAEQRKRAEQVGKDFAKIVKEHGGDPKTVSIMFHDQSDRMWGTYSGASGVQVQK